MVTTAFAANLHGNQVQYNKDANKTEHQNFLSKGCVTS
jgi:hypothetical protein